jgi:hypothetical protein
MKPYKKILFYVLISLAFAGIAVFALGVVNTMVSLTYETENPTDCNSLISGQDLCFTIKILEGLVVVCLGILIGLIAFRKRFLQ